MAVVIWVWRSERQAGLRHLPGWCFAPWPSAPHLGSDFSFSCFSFCIPQWRSPRRGHWRSPSSPGTASDCSGKLSLPLTWLSIRLSGAQLVERNFRRYGSTYSSGEVGVALCLLDSSELTCKGGMGRCKTILFNALSNLNSSAPSEGAYGVRQGLSWVWFSSVERSPWVLEARGTAGCHPTDSGKIAEVFWENSRMKFNRDKQKVLSLGRNN